jgi:hypothetical protein
MSPERAKLIKQGLLKDKAFWDKYKDAYKEIKNFLKEANKKENKF